MRPPTLLGQGMLRKVCYHGKEKKRGVERGVGDAEGLREMRGGRWEEKMRDCSN